MDEGSDGRFLSRIRNLFRKPNGHQLEEHIMDAKDEGAIPPEEVSMLLNILDLGKKKVEDIMVPRIEIACSEVDDGVEDVVELAISSGHSRIPIYEETKDHMVGLVHSKDLLKLLLRPCGPDGKEASVREIMRPVFFVSGTASIRSLLRQFQAERMHLGIVRDEYGGTAGLVTMEDVLEEIVGDIEDEYDVLRPDEIEKLPDGAMLVSGRALLEDVNEACGLSLASEEVETIGGYLSQIHGDIPKGGEVFELEGWKFAVQDADAKHVRLIRITPPPAAS